MDDNKKDWIRQLLGRWFGAGGYPEEERPEAPPASPEKSPASLNVEDVSEPQPKVPPIALEVSKKLSALRNAVELGQDAVDGLCEVHSTEDMLLYSYKVIFRKFMCFQEIGLVSEQSSLALDAIHRKYQSILKSQQSQAPEADSTERKRLEEENRALRAQLKRIKAESVKQGIISERELKLDEEVEYLKRRLREEAVQMEIARKKNEVALAGVEMANALLAKNGLLNARLANQERLLRSMTAKSPRFEELTEKLEALRDENRRLKEVIQDRADLEEQLKALPDAGLQAGKQLESLLASNRGLKAELSLRGGRLDELVSVEAQGDVTEVIEQLSDENFELTTILETGRAIRECALGRESGGVLHERILDLLKVENQRLQAALTAKEEQLKVLSSNPAHRSMMKAVIRLKDENKRLSKALEVRGRMYEQWEEEKKQLQIQARRGEEFMRENNAIRTRLESGEQVIKTLQKALANYQALKKEYSTVLSRYESGQVEIANMKKRLSKITAQHDMMVKEYENIFGHFK